ncbi:hypothetical protein R3P38DRAFT_2812828 [Favolaschia claudopus]|uniref:Uncharacterized protein n=1 Tax=Favolaschia claudopus TaxID=2862362 RepID=A0AAV9Z640_9AGAR
MHPQFELFHAHLSAFSILENSCEPEYQGTKLKFGRTKHVSQSCCFFSAATLSQGIWLSSEAICGYWHVTPLYIAMAAPEALGIDEWSQWMWWALVLMYSGLFQLLEGAKLAVSELKNFVSGIRTLATNHRSPFIWTVRDPIHVSVVMDCKGRRAQEPS